MFKSEEKSVLLDVPCKLYIYKRGSRSFMVNSLRTEPSPLSASRLISLISVDSVHRSVPPALLLPVLRRFANRSGDDDLCCYCTYLMLSELKRRPLRPGPAGGLLLTSLGWPTPAIRTSLLSSFFRDTFGLNSRINWDHVLGKRTHSELQRRALTLRGRWPGDPSILITILDSFNDLLLQRLSRKHAALKGPFRSAAGRHKIPDYGAWVRNPAVSTVLPVSVPTLVLCHDLRLKADIAHATLKKSGRFTRPVTYWDRDRLVRKLRNVYSEFLSVFNTL